MKMNDVTAYLVFWTFKWLQKTRHKVCLPCKTFDNRAFNETYTFLEYLIMAHDELRNEAYNAVISKCVKDRTVVEIGAGALTVLTDMCIKAGCAKVFALESNPRSASSAREKIKRKKLDKVEIIEGFSLDISLPVKADVLLSDLIGTIASNEGAALVIDDARKRFVHANAAIIPQSCSSVIAPAGPLRLTPFDRFWSRLESGFDKFEPGVSYIVSNFPLDLLLAAAQICETIDFQNAIELRNQKKCSFVMDKESEFSGVVFGNRLYVDNHNVIDSLSMSTNWWIPYLPLFDPPLPLEKGDRIDMTFTCDLATITPKYRLNIDVIHQDKIAVNNLVSEWSGAFFPKK